MGSFAWTDASEASAEALPAWTNTDVEPRHRNRSLHQLSRESLFARSGTDVDDTSVLTEIPHEAPKLRRRATTRYTEKQLTPVAYKRFPRKNLQNIEKGKTIGNGKTSTHLPDIYIFAPCTLQGIKDASVIAIEAFPPINFRSSSSGTQEPSQSTQLG